MTKNDYIEKITQNLEHLTKDELKDVSILTTAQYGVRLKFAERQQLEHEIANLTPQLQQQALPVVPECVGSFLSGKSIFGIANGDIPGDVISWVQEQTYYVDLEKIISHLISIKVTGFTVEKPQLFYLKHIDMSKADKEFDHYLFRIEVDRLAHHIVNKNNLPHNYRSVTFTQQEIDSMETGSYEQIEVAE
ncbi:DUF1642 domain-containing protein [Lactococcus lactis]|uniref:Prophage pi3 protein 37 n=1 Tax=Lactococcus lactis subsp. lactis TaxID=1360 RepID=A0A0V8EBX0_LACLL|nr:DUF1642 domain-containing protein [Lactococcus lactis]KSU23364.1 prophage pi3 protein 37 [Lactococcus lactis subsp. lactis]